MTKGMTNWAWFWGGYDDEAMAGEFKTRSDAIASAEAALPAGEPFKIIEARMSTAKKYEGADFIPFLRVRNGEDRIAGEPGK